VGLGIESMRGLGIESMSLDTTRWREGGRTRDAGGRTMPEAGPTLEVGPHTPLVKSVSRRRSPLGWGVDRVREMTDEVDSTGERRDERADEQ
jgi:hypothetical protein